MTWDQYEWQLHNIWRSELKVRPINSIVCNLEPTSVPLYRAPQQSGTGRLLNGRPLHQNMHNANVGLLLELQTVSFLLLYKMRTTLCARGPFGLQAPHISCSELQPRICLRSKTLFRPVRLTSLLLSDSYYNNDCICSPGGGKVKVL